MCNFYKLSLICISFLLNNHLLAVNYRQCTSNQLQKINKLFTKDAKEELKSRCSECSCGPLGGQQLSQLTCKCLDRHDYVTILTTKGAKAQRQYTHLQYRPSSIDLDPALSDNSLQISDSGKLDVIERVVQPKLNLAMQEEDPRIVPEELISESEETTEGGWTWDTQGPYLRKFYEYEGEYGNAKELYQIFERDMKDEIVYLEGMLKNIEIKLYRIINNKESLNKVLPLQKEAKKILDHIYILEDMINDPEAVNMLSKLGKSSNQIVLLGHLEALKDTIATGMIHIQRYAFKMMPSIISDLTNRTSSLQLSFNKDKYSNDDLSILLPSQKLLLEQIEETIETIQNIVGQEEMAPLTPEQASWLQDLIKLKQQVKKIKEETEKILNTIDPIGWVLRQLAIAGH